MNRTFRTLVLWLLVLALPVQGYAASSRMACDTAHAVAADAPHHAMSAMPQHEHDAGSQQDHHMMQADDISVDVVASAVEPKKTDAKCSVCAACCIGMALLPAAMDLPFAANGSSSFLSASSPLFDGHIPDGLKRPPRSLRV